MPKRQKLQESLLACATVCFSLQHSIQDTGSLAHEAKEEEDEIELR
jgi:hypothetical protein